MTLVFCSYSLNKKENVQLYILAKSLISFLFFKPVWTNSSQWSSLLKSKNLYRPLTKEIHRYLVTCMYHNNFQLSGYKVKYKAQNILYVMALIRKVSV